MEEITVKGIITEVGNGEFRVNRGYTHGYTSFRLKVGRNFFRVSFASRKMNDFYYMPKVGHWVRVTGRLIHSRQDFYDDQIKWVSALVHIERPK